MMLMIIGYSNDKKIVIVIRSLKIIISRTLIILVGVVCVYRNLMGDIAQSVSALEEQQVITHPYTSGDSLQLNIDKDSDA